MFGVLLVSKFVLTTLFLLSGTVYAHEGESPKPGEWVEKNLTIRHASNWNIEHCFKLPGNNTVRYRFTVDIPLNFDFHVHPETEDGTYRTEHLDRESNIRSREGQVKGELPGNYCFDFFPPQQATEDKEIRLFYRID